MENKEIVSPIPVQMVIKMPNNSLEESKYIGNNAAEDFFRLPAVKEENTEVFHSPGFSADLQIVEKKINPSNDASFMNSDHAINSMLKVEPGNEYFEMENDSLYISRNTHTHTRTEIIKANANVIPVACSSECKQVFPNQKELVKSEKSEAINESNLSYDVTWDDLKIKNEDVDIKDDSLKKGTGDEEIFPIKPVVKIENCEAWNESEQVHGVFFEDWKIKNEEVDIEEADLKNETSMVPFCGQEKQSGDQRMRNQNLRRQNPLHKTPVIMAPRKKSTREECLEKKRLAERLRYQRIKNDPKKYSQQKEKDKKNYERRKEKGTIKTVNQMTPREIRKVRKSWREKKARLRKQRLTLQY